MIDESPDQIRRNGDLIRPPKLLEGTYLGPSSLRLREVPKRLSCLCGPTLSLRSDSCHLRVDSKQFPLNHGTHQDLVFITLHGF